MGNTQNPTPIATSNTKTTGVVNNNMVIKKSKYRDMNLHFLRDKEVKNYFTLRWCNM